MQLRGRQTQFYIDIIYGLGFAVGFGYLLFGGMDPRVAAFQGGLVFGYILRVWENMTIYERILQEEVAAEAEEAVAEEVARELEEQVPGEVTAEVEKQVPEEMAAEIEEQVGEEFDERVADEVEERFDEEIDERVAQEIEAQMDDHERPRKQKQGNGTSEAAR